MAMRLESLRQAGGVNSIDNFARSWQRAAAFNEITPVRTSFRFADDEDIGGDLEDNDSTPKGRSLLRHALQSGRAAAGGDDSDAAIDDAASMAPTTQTEATENDPLIVRDRASLPRPGDENIFLIEPSLASPFGGSYGSTWGSLSSRVNEPSMRHAGRLFRQQQQQNVASDKEREPLTVRRIEEEDGNIVTVVVGQSTLPQTIFNSVNTLIGVGILALPLAFDYSGWFLGLLFFIFAAVTTCYTAKLLAKCADVDSSLITFADLAYVSFGPWARIAVSILFIIELLGACVALVVLFADSLSALLPEAGLTLDEWKVVFGILLIPLCFVPLRLLSFTSILGIISCFGIVVAVTLDGLIKAEAPGSLRQPAATSLWPRNWAALPISWGIMMAPWGGHSVFPNIYRDMRHPYKYRRGVNISYGFTFVLDLLMAVVGFLMFGHGVKDEVTRNILLAPEGAGYPRPLSIFIVICLAIIPITKGPLNARPIYSTIELTLGLDARVTGPIAGTDGGIVNSPSSALARGLYRLFVRIGCCVIFVIVAILIPDFDRLMSLIGAGACFAICLILPAAFHLRLFGAKLSPLEKARDILLIIVSLILAIVSIVFTCMPRERLGM